MPAKMEFKQGFWIGLGLLGALFIAGLAISMVSKAVS